MQPGIYSALINAACVIAWLMVMLPALLFLRRSWASRRDSLFELMTDGVVDLYYQRFSPAKKIDPALRVKTFRTSFGRKYGRRWYIPPLVLMGTVSFFGLVGVAHTIRVWQGVAAPGDTFAMPAIAVAGFLGGMMWVISDQLSRFRRRDFTSHDVYNSVFRLLIAVPLGISIAALGSASLQVPLAFVLGVFPTNTLFTITRRIGLKQLGMSDDASGQGSELEKLQSVGKETAERFRDEGIASIAALAWADPIDLTIRTNLDFGFVIDCISQALLWVYVRDDVQKLFVLSLRGAQEVSYFMEELNSTDPKVNAEATKTLAEASQRLNVSVEAFHQTLVQVAEDPSTMLLVRLWSPKG